MTANKELNDMNNRKEMVDEAKANYLGKSMNGVAIQ